MLRFKLKFKIAVFAVQIFAVLLLQSYFMLPLYRAFSGEEKKCYQNHRLCGCAPGRVADKTCCCFRDVPRCCLDRMSETAEDPHGGHGEEAVRHALSNVPCGDYSDFATVSLEKIKFLSTVFAVTSIMADTPDYGRCSAIKFSNRCLEPPDPPPRLIIPA